MYQLRYDPKVGDDLKKLDPPVRSKILKQIEKKLSLAPVEFGKPLRHSLKGFYRLRVGDYRVIYEIDEKAQMVTTWMVEKRKDDEVYIEFLKRLKSS